MQQLISNVILFQLTFKGLAQKKGHSVLLRIVVYVVMWMYLCCQLYACLKTSHDVIYIYIVSSAVSMLKRPTITDYQSAESEQLMKRLRPGGHGVDEVILHLQFCT